MRTMSSMGCLHPEGTRGRSPAFIDLNRDQVRAMPGSGHVGPAANLVLMTRAWQRRALDVAPHRQDGGAYSDHPLVRAPTGASWRWAEVLVAVTAHPRGQIPGLSTKTKAARKPGIWMGLGAAGDGGLGAPLSWRWLSRFPLGRPCSREARRSFGDCRSGDRGVAPRV